MIKNWKKSDKLYKNTKKVQFAKGKDFSNFISRKDLYQILQDQDRNSAALTLKTLT